METRVFVFELMGPNQLVERPEGGSGTVKGVDDYRKDGWKPIHWDNISPLGHPIVRYRVVMERGYEHSVGNG